MPDWLDFWRRSWPGRLSEVGASHVAPRLVVGSSAARALRLLRRDVGEAIVASRRKATLIWRASQLRTMRR
jgi:hypothetical protein